MSNSTSFSKRSPNGGSKHDRSKHHQGARQARFDSKVRLDSKTHLDSQMRSARARRDSKPPRSKAPLSAQQTSPQILIGRLQTLIIESLSPHGAYLIAAQDIQNQASNPLVSESTPFQNPPTQTAQSTPHAPRHAISQASHQPLTRVLLPKKFLPPNPSEGMSLKVFVLHDSEDRPVATTQRPKAQLGDIAALEVVSIEERGCFLDLGLDKHIFMPSLYPRQFKRGQRVVALISQDKQSRLLARLQVKSALKPLRLHGDTKPHELLVRKVKALVFEETPLGFGCVLRLDDVASLDSTACLDSEISESRYRADLAHYGLLYKSELSVSPRIGDELEVKIKALRKDGKLDLVLHHGETGEIKGEILKSMPLELSFSSPTEAIFARFGISKKLFKRLINELVREGKIEFIPSQQRFVRGSNHTKE